MVEAPPVEPVREVYHDYDAHREESHKDERYEGKQCEEGSHSLLFPGYQVFCLFECITDGVHRIETPCGALFEILQLRIEVFVFDVVILLNLLDGACSLSELLHGLVLRDLSLGTDLVAQD